MSFGASIGDVLLVINLTRNIIYAFRAAPSDFDEVEKTVKSLNILLESLEREVTSETSVFGRDHEKAEQLGLLVHLCHRPLTQLCEILDRFQSLGTSDVKILDRLRFSRGTVFEIQRELSLRYANLTAFLETLGLGGIGRIENKVDGICDTQVLILEGIEHTVGGFSEQQDLILKAIDKIAVQVSQRSETVSVLSNHSNDDKEVWKHLRRDLVSAGFRSSDIERHKALIVDKLTELHKEGILDWDTSTVVNRGNEIPHTFYAHESVHYQPPFLTGFSGSSTPKPAHNSTYKPPTASTVCDSDDEDAQSTTETLMSVRTPRMDSARNSIYKPFAPNEVGQTFVPGSPARSLRNTLPASPRSFNKTIAATERVLQRAKSDIVRPSMKRPSGTNGPQSNESMRFQPKWRYRRPADMISRHIQISTNLQDDTLPRFASEGNTERVRQLLANGSNTEAAGPGLSNPSPEHPGTTALFRAARAGHMETAHLLLRYGASANPLRYDGKSLVRLLAGDGYTEIIRLLIEYGAHVQGQGALPQAALFGHLNTVRLLLDYGANIDETEKDQTPLYRAVWKGHTSIVECLLQRGANTAYVTPSGRSALYKAVQNGDNACVDLLLRYGAQPGVGCGEESETALFRACVLGDKQIVRSLLRHRADPNAGVGRYTPTILGANSAANVENGNKFDASTAPRPNFTKLTPLHAAAKTGNIAIARMLLQYGANVNARASNGEQPIHIATSTQQTEMTRLLLDAGAEASRPSSRYTQDSTRELPVSSRRARRSTSARPRAPANRQKHSSQAMSTGAGMTAAMLLFESLDLLS